MNAIWQSIITNIKQRTRQQSYIVSLLAMTALTMLFFPAPDSEYQTLIINGYRGIYNSSWIGVCLAMLNMLFLPLICFYLVKNVIELDRRSNTCELIASTPISKLVYLFSKWCSNVFVLLSIMVVMIISSILVQLYYGESYHIQLWELIWPQLVFVFPVLLAVVSIALMFESIKWLRGGFGNIAYFFFWIGSITYILESVSGVGSLMKSLDSEVAERFPSQLGNSNVGVTLTDEKDPIKTFIWQGVEPTLTDLWGMLPLLIISLSCLIVAYLCFDRFSQNSSSETRHASWLKRTFLSKINRSFDICLTALTKHFSFSQLVYLELKLLLKGRSIFWFVGLFVLNVIQFVIDKSLLISLFLPLSWLWCVLVISQLGQFEKQSGTQELIIYSQKSSVTQSLASYLAAWSLLIIASLGAVIRFSTATELLLLAQLMIGISFTVSLAYFCGAITGTKRMFEGLYPLLWYMGPIQATLYLDFFGVNSQLTWQAGMPYFFGAISVGLLILTIGVKKKY